MAARLILSILGLAVIAALSAAVTAMHQRYGRLSAEASRLERIQAACAGLNEENRRFRAALTEAGDLNSLRNRFAEIERMRASVNALELQRSAMKRALGQRVDAVWPEGAAVRRAKDWSFRGQASPADAVESLLWSARAGDVDRLGGLIRFEPSAEKKAEALLAGLPEAARAQYGSPEKVVATMIAAQIPADYSAIATVRETEPDPDSAMLTLRLEDGSGTQRDLELKFQREQDSWRLDVPEGVVNRLAVQLESPASPVH